MITAENSYLILDDVRFRRGISGELQSIAFGVFALSCIPLFFAEFLHGSQWR